MLACSSHVEKGDRVAVSVAVEQLKSDSQWSVGITRGTSLNGSNTGKDYIDLFAHAVLNRINKTFIVDLAI